LTEINAKSQKKENLGLESRGWGGSFAWDMPDSAKDAFDGIMEMFEDGEKQHSSMEFADLGEAVKALMGLVKKQGSHGMTKKQLVVWIVCEVIATDVSLDELSDWLKHKPTIDEIVFGDDPSSMISLLTSTDGKAAEKRFKSLVKKML
jgi:hypothetical protein